MFALADTHQLSEGVQLAAKLIPTTPLLAMLLCGLLCTAKSQSVKHLAGWVVVLSVGFSFLCSLCVAGGLAQLPAESRHAVVHYFEWINIGAFAANFSFYIDSLTVVMLFVVTGIGTLIAIYASGYMAGDVGYARFFAYIGLFIFAMTCLVMGDNLLMLFLGWEGVGAASYLLIGFYYRKPAAVAAAKKAFIVNRVGDFGFAVGLMLTFVLFGTVQYDQFLPTARGMVFDDLAPWQQTAAIWIPFLLMLGAFGKSAQIPLHVWLPDAMEGPTPVSALIHAATMVTAGVYMIARLIALFMIDPNHLALSTVAIVGGVTSLFAATIALCQYDIKRIWAYSTLSQLGYMFMGVGVLGTTGAVFHLYTHAFFKALLFLTAGSVMHALAGQLDLRKMSGLRHKMPVTCWLMFIGCLALAGVAPLAGFFSKDMIITDAGLWSRGLGMIGLLVAALTAFYTFRLWFRVFWGPERYEMGREHHGYESDHDDHGHDDHHHHAPHDPAWWVNVPLVVLAIGALAAGFACQGWMKEMIGMSSAHVNDATMARFTGTGDAHGYHEAHEKAHHMVSLISVVVPLVMIFMAYYFHLRRRDATERIAAKFPKVVALLHNKYYIDEIYDWFIRIPLRIKAYVLYTFDRFVLDAFLINWIIGNAPRWLGRLQQPAQRGTLQSYAWTMALGVVVILFLLAWKAVASS